VLPGDVISSYIVPLFSIEIERFFSGHPERELLD
jgi:hypothetical protein